MKRSWPHLRRCPDICLQGLKICTKNFPLVSSLRYETGYSRISTRSAATRLRRSLPDTNIRIGQQDFLRTALRGFCIRIEFCSSSVHRSTFMLPA